MQKTLSIIIPCFNESATIRELLDRVINSDCCGLLKEIILVDDGSTDKTRQILSKIKNEAVKVILQDKNMGKGWAVKTGMLASNGDVVLIQDADLEYDPGEYTILLEPLLSDRADVVYGSRFMGGRPHRVVYYWHAVLNTLLTSFSNMLTNINLTDMETCYKVFRGDLARKIALNLKSKRFGFEPEVTAKLSKINNIRIYEVGISYYGRTYAEGKHINWVDGLRAFFEIIRFNLFDND